MSNRVTLQDIADALGITKVTVSRALKGQQGVGEALRKKIEEQSLKMGYTRSSLHEDAHILNFAFITPKHFFLKTEHFYTDIYYYLHKLCDHKRYRISLQIIDPDMEESLVLPNNLTDTSISGIFIGGEISREYLEKIGSLSVPKVILDFYSAFPQFSHVTVDNFYLGYKAALYLLERGHKNIGFIGQKNISSNVTDRMLGMQKALEENGQTLREEWTIENHNPRTGLYTMDFNLPEVLPTAFLCHCDRAAYFLIEKLKLRKISVPGDLSIVSFDDTETALETTPPLTSVKIDRVQFAKAGLDLMEKHLENPDTVEKRIYLDTELIERQSVKELR